MEVTIRAKPIAVFKPVQSYEYHPYSERVTLQIESQYNIPVNIVCVSIVGYHSFGRAIVLLRFEALI